MKQVLTILTVFMFLTMSAFGQSKSLQFNNSGTNDIVTATDFSSLGSVYTIEGWIKPTSLPDENHLFSFYDGSTGNQFYLYSSGYVTASPASTRQAWVQLSTNTWYHLAYVSTATTLTIYIDGVKNWDGAWSEATNGAQTTLVLGHMRTDGNLLSSTAFIGYMDELRVWSTARTETEINDNKDKELVGNEAGLFAYYNFNDESGTTLTDRTSGGRNATLYNMDPAGDWSTDSPVLTPVPVELTSFTSVLVDGSVLLNWETATEVNNLGFNVESSNDGENFTAIGFVEGHGNSNTPNNYSFVATDGAKYYRLKQLDVDGGSEYSDVVEVALQLAYKLNQNHPNPFNPSTTVSFTLPQSIRANVSVYNALGQKIMEVANREFTAGTHNVKIDASQLSSGMYFYKLETSDFSKTMKMMLLK